ncbi:hypothetical protein M8J77_013344 [Diaphorina citri]|nr:hypothetical protein M8J77_013344 [Diaphorina citri]
MSQVQWITSRRPPPVQLSRPSNHPGPNSLIDQSCRGGAAPGSGDGDVVANANNNNNNNISKSPSMNKHKFASTLHSPP